MTRGSEGEPQREQEQRSKQAAMAQLDALAARLLNPAAEVTRGRRTLSYRMRKDQVGVVLGQMVDAGLVCGEDSTGKPLSSGYMLVEQFNYADRSTTDRVLEVGFADNQPNGDETAIRLLLTGKRASILRYACGMALPATAYDERGQHNSEANAEQLRALHTILLQQASNHNRPGLTS